MRGTPAPGEHDRRVVENVVFKEFRHGASDTGVTHSSGRSMQPHSRREAKTEAAWIAWNRKQVYRAT